MISDFGLVNFVDLTFNGYVSKEKGWVSRRYEDGVKATPSAFGDLEVKHSASLDN